MELLLQRISDNGDSSIGVIFHKDSKEFKGFTLEDEHRDVKVKGETRIPAGKYELKIRKEDTPLTLKHRDAYGSWFRYHIEVTGIPNFSGVYIHAGNDDDHTDGCLLVCNTMTNHFIQQKNPGASSVDAVRRLYSLVYPHLESGKKAFIEIRDEVKLYQ